MAFVEMKDPKSTDPKHCAVCRFVGGGGGGPKRDPKLESSAQSYLVEAMLLWLSTEDLTMQTWMFLTWV